MKKNRLAIILCIAFIILFVIPAKAEEQPYIFVNHSSAVIQKGNSIQIVSTLENSSSQAVSKVYKSSNETVASVSKSGTVKGKKEGSTTITVTVETDDKESFSKKVKITVKNTVTSETPYISVSGVGKLSEGKSITLKSKLKNSQSEIKTTTFKSSNSKIAKVSTAGKVTGVKDGTTVITVTSKTKDKHTLVKTVKVKVSTTLAQRVAMTKTAKKTDQIITVAGGKLTFWKKSENSWKSVLTASCYVGRNGVSDSKKEGDGKTPSGSYSIPFTFGLGNNPGTKLKYRKITKKSYWISNTKDKDYNTWQERTTSSSKDERLIKISVYKYAMVINYNSACTPGKGSAIFIHCSYGKPTSGCVAISKSKMLSLMKKVNKGAYIIIAESEAKISKY